MKFAHAAADSGTALALKITRRSLACNIKHRCLTSSLAEPSTEDLMCVSTQKRCYAPEKAPRLTIDLHLNLRAWKPVLSWRWQYRAHINILELLGAARVSEEFPVAQVVHFLHIQVCHGVSLAVLIKGRPSSRKLKHILQRMAALLIAGYCMRCLASLCLHQVRVQSGSCSVLKPWANAHP